MEHYENMCENSIEWLRRSDKATVSAPNGSKLKGKLIKLANKYPDEVDYIENKDGSVVGHVPVSYIHISRRKRELTDEQREEIAERMRKARQVE